MQVAADTLAGYDYEPQSGHLFFLRGQSTKEIKILIIDDEEVEVDKHFTVTLSQPENCTLHRKQQLKVTIIDDDQNIWQSIKRSTWYTVIEVVLIVYALFGNEILMLILLGLSKEREERLPSEPPLSAQAVDVGGHLVGSARPALGRVSQAVQQDHAAFYGTLASRWRDLDHIRLVVDVHLGGKRCRRAEAPHRRR